MKFNEQQLKKIAKNYMSKARAGDWNHALRVVKWVKRLGKNRKDIYLLITAAYIHDIGWSGVAPSGILNLDKILKLEKKANDNSSKLIIEVLNKLKYNKTEMETVNRLIAAADEHKSNSDDEAIIVDSDNLSKLCVGHIKQKYKPDSYGKIINLLESDLRKGIKTAEGRKLYPVLLAKLKKSKLFIK